MQGTDPGVCLMTETFHPVTGGGETQARVLAEGLRAAGGTVHVVTRLSDAALPRQEIIDGVPVHRIGPSGPGHLRKWGMVLTAFPALIRLRRHYDVILVCGFRVLGIPAVMAGLLLGKPCVLKADSQGELSGRFFDPGLARMGLRHDRFPVRPLVLLRNVLLRRARRFVAMSSVIEREYLEGSIPANRIAVIPNSVDTAKFRPVPPSERGALRQKLGIPAGRPIAVFTGRLVTTKGLPTLLRAWRPVVAAHPDALLLLVGSGGLGLQNCEAALKRYTSENALEGHVHFAGAVDNVNEYLQASDLFVFPTEEEAFGISVIEAMACGLPVVTTGVDGMRDIVRSGVDALLVPPGDDAALARAIRRVLQADDRFGAMAAASMDSVRERYSVNDVVGSYRDLLASVRRP